jgi:hypothetical protein
MMKTELLHEPGYPIVLDPLKGTAVISDNDVLGTTLRGNLTGVICNKFYYKV